MTDGEDDEVAEPVEVLVGMAENGEIDPWDIDIVAVTDKFLDRLDEGDLRTSGRALFYASVLLRMKGDAMLADDDEPEEPRPDPWEEAMVGDEPVDGPDPFAALETEMDRRLERKRARGMPQTLDELVRDLREAERDNWWKESREYDTSDSPAGYQRGTQELDYRSGDDLRMDDEPTAADVTERVHTEEIDEVIDDVYGAVRDHYEKGRVEVLYRERSPITHVGNMTAPVFVVHGVNDPRCPVSQARTFRDALLERGWEEGPEGDFEYEELAEEGHGSADAEQKVRAFGLIGEFLNRRL